MTADLRLAAAAVERAAQRCSWALAEVTHGSLAGAELQVNHARIALESAALVLQAEDDDRHRQLHLPLGGER